MVSAWSSRAGIVLGQVSTDEKSNEITAIPALLDTLALKGAIITIDAAGCQTAITAKIIEKKADYVIALKMNQPTLCESTAKLLTGYGAGGRDLNYHSTHETGHGREEERRCWVSTDVEDLERAEKFAGLASIIRIESVRTIDGRTSTRDRFYISSLPKLSAKRALALVRSHWGIENELHWTLDMAFREDESRIRAENAAENFSRVRQHSLGLLKTVKNVKVGIETKRMMAGWNDSFLLQVLVGGAPA